MRQGLGSFAVEPDRMQAWLDDLAGMTEARAHAQAMPYVPADWDPLELGEEATISSLVRHACLQGVICGPPGMSIGFEFSPDSAAGGSYRTLVHVREGLSIACRAQEMLALVPPTSAGGNGPDGVRVIIGKTVRQANYALDQLSGYVDDARPALLGRLRRRLSP